ncbi:hypothetical protein EJB05_14326, partial [Eragrostis curvula]
MSKAINSMVQLIRTKLIICNNCKSKIEYYMLAKVEEAEQGRHPVEGTVAAEEAGVGDDSEPWLADERGADEVLGLVRREPEEDLGGDVFDQLRRRRHGAPADFGRRLGNSNEARYTTPAPRLTGASWFTLIFRLF